MTPEAAGALARYESLIRFYQMGHPEADMSSDWEAVECMRRELSKVTATAAIYHEGIERIGGRCDVRG